MTTKRKQAKSSYTTTKKKRKKKETAISYVQEGQEASHATVSGSEEEKNWNVRPKPNKQKFSAGSRSQVYKFSL
jgi:hypothetical protein